MAGALFVVATPIGNLEDLTFRALRTLKEVDFIAAEDTRRTSKLLAHYQIHKPLVSLREHNEVRETPRLVARISAGETMALVSDAGTPGIADPGTRLVRAVRAAGLKIVPIPGASAIATALSVSGFPASQFVFCGFPPASGSERSEWFRILAAERRTSVFFEAPHRIQRTLKEAASLLADRPILVCREISKIHEELVEYSNSSSVLGILQKQKGEFTLVVAPVSAPTRASDEIDAADVIRIFGLITDTVRPERDVAIEILAKYFSSDRSAIKKIVKQHIMSGK